MTKEPARRYQSAGELAVDLERFLAGLPVLARRVPIWRRAVAWIKVHRTAVALVATGVAAAVLIASVSDHLRRKEAEFLARRFESAGIAELAELIPRVNVTDPAVAAWLDRLYNAGTPDQKLAAALVLAPTRSACEDYVLDQFLSSDPRLLGLLTPLVSRQIPRSFVNRLEAEIQGVPVAALSFSEAELRDRRTGQRGLCPDCARPRRTGLETPRFGPGSSGSLVPDCDSRSGGSDTRTSRRPPQGSPDKQLLASGSHPKPR